MHVHRTIGPGDFEGLLRHPCECKVVRNDIMSMMVEPRGQDNHGAEL